jgi:hypothetical protein
VEKAMEQNQLDKVTVDKFLMTPSKAKELLDCNTKNRRASDLSVSLYARDMAANKFHFNGHSVCVSETGILLDGQQRLMACEKSNKPFWTILVRNLPEEAILTIDSGKKRTFGDQLKIEEYDSYNGLAACVKMLALIAVRNPKDTGYTKSELMGILNKHKDVSESVSFCKKTFHKADNLISAIHYIATQTGYEQQACEFVRTWRDGQINYDNDPIVYIRNKLQNDMRNPQKMATVTRMKYIMLSWHKFKTSSEMKSAKITSDGFYMDFWDRKKCGLE